MNEVIKYLLDSGFEDVGSGYYIYPFAWRPENRLDKNGIPFEKDYINVYINNQTIIVANMKVKGLKPLYHYLQTYPHIPRGEVDKNGYYQRSTEGEVIRYIDMFYKKYNTNLRKEKIEKLLWD